MGSNVAPSKWLQFIAQDTLPLSTAILGGVHEATIADRKRNNADRKRNDSSMTIRRRVWAPTCGAQRVLLCIRSSTANRPDVCSIRDGEQEGMPVVYDRETEIRLPDGNDWTVCSTESPVRLLPPSATTDPPTRLINLGARFTWNGDASTSITRTYVADAISDAEFWHLFCTYFAVTRRGRERGVGVVPVLLPLQGFIQHVRPMQRRVVCIDF